MTIADLKNLSEPPRTELHIPMSRDEFVATVGELRAEWAYGEAIIMAPDNTEHGDLNSWLGSLLRYYVDAKDLGQIFINNIETRLPTGTNRIPDILFVAKSRLPAIRETFVDGPPDLAVEIVSPDSVTRDYREKFTEYQDSGVREYWLIDPAHQRLNAYALTGRTYCPIALKDDKLHSVILPGFYLRPAWLWSPVRPPLPRITKELGL